MSKKADNSPPGTPIRVAIIEDDQWLRENLAEELGGSDDFECVGAYGTSEEALDELPNRDPDVAIVDINLPGLNGIECLKRLKPQCPETQFLILTAYEESENIFNALLAGAAGYLLKRTGMADVLGAIRDVHRGESPMSGHIARRVVQYFGKMGAGSSDIEQLSPREREVLELLARGAAYKQIADQLDLSIETIRMNIKHIYAKLHVHSRGEAVAKYRGWPA
jgi:DNA-binding NarL/FixJ family response regulator